MTEQEIIAALTEIKTAWCDLRILAYEAAYKGQIAEIRTRTTHLGLKIDRLLLQVQREESKKGKDHA